MVPSRRNSSNPLAWLLLLSVSILVGVPRAQAQTPSPLQDWQYSGGIVLRQMFEPHVPTWQVTLGASAAWQPLYDGAKPYKVEPGPAIDIRYKNLAFASVGDGIGVNVLRGSNYRAGIAVAYDLGRRVADYPSHLTGLGNIAPAPVVKLFASYAISKSFPLVLRADLRRDIGGANGWIGDLSMYLPLPGSSKKFVMFAGPSVTFAGQQYMQKWFGVDSIQALHSGYPEYRAGAGLKAAGFGFSATWFITKHWLLNGNAAVSRLLGSAADSPITEQRTQETVNLTFAYTF